MFSFVYLCNTIVPLKNDRNMNKIKEGEDFITEDRTVILNSENKLSFHDFSVDLSQKKQLNCSDYDLI